MMRIKKKQEFYNSCFLGIKVSFSLNHSVAVVLTVIGVVITI